MAENIDSAKIVEYKECFNLYDRDKDGMISIDQISVVMRSLGQCPSERELKEMTSKLGKKKITFPEFLELMWKMMQKVRDPEQDIYRAFEVYDQNKAGVITMRDLHHIVTRTGEKLSRQEFDYMVKQMGIPKNSTYVNYADLAKVFGHV